MMATGKTIKVFEVIAESSQINPSLAWRMLVDGARNSLSAGAGVVLKSPEGAIFEHCLRLNFLTTNNEAKYKAFIGDSGLPAS